MKINNNEIIGMDISNLDPYNLSYIIAVLENANSPEFIDCNSGASNSIKILRNVLINNVGKKDASEMIRTAHRSIDI